MKKRQFDSVFFFRQLKKLFLPFLLIPVIVEAQAGQQIQEFEMRISYDTSILPEQIGLHRDDSFSWKLLDSSSVMLANESFGSLYNYKFSVPGTYNLSVESVHGVQDHVCSNHGFSGVWKVIVSPIKVTFDVESLVFSEPLVLENLMNSIEILVPVTISFFDNSINDLSVNELRLKIQGVDCNFNINYHNSNELLHEGRSFIRLNVVGEAPKGTFIMFDFEDHNGTITTYYPTNEL